MLVRTGETVDILLDVSNPGLWMAHCHIAEHHESGMMFSFNVAPQRRSVTAWRALSRAADRPPRAAAGPAIWGLVVGVAQAATPLAFWWLDTATVYALGLAVIASVYIGFAVADGRWIVLAVETGVASMFVIIAAAAITGTPWLLVVGLAGHEDLDPGSTALSLWPTRGGGLRFVFVVDFVVAAIIAVEIVAGVPFTGR